MVELLAPNTALVPKGFALLNAMVLRLGLFVPGVMPVTVPVVAPTLVTAVAVGAVTLVTAVPVVGVTLAAAVPMVGVTLATADPLVVAKVVPLVKNDACPGLAVTPVKAAAIVGVTDVTTVVPGVPLTPLTTLAEVEVTPVTHVSAEAEDNSPALRLPTVSAARSVWFEADDNSANRTAARRGIIICVGLAICPLRVWTSLRIAESLWQNFAKGILTTRAFGRICCGCCNDATIRFTRAHAGEDKEARNA
jgi:hypothetical protein